MHDNRVEQMIAVQTTALALFKKKNTDYGDAFAEFGVIGVLMRIEDKIKRSLSITKNGISVIQGTSYGSKYDPTNTIFAIEDESLKKLVDFFNRFNIGVNLSLEDFNFLRNI